MNSLLRRVWFYSSAVVVTFALTALPAAAQSTGTSSTTGSTGTPPTTGTSGAQAETPDPNKPAEPAVAQPLAPASQSRWATVGGWETDSHNTGYGFFGPTYTKPIRPNLAFAGSANFNYLYYEYGTANGYTSVRSPGVSLMGGVQIGEKNWLLLQAGPTFKRRQLRELDPSDNLIHSTSDTHVGLNLGTSLWVDPTSHNNVFVMFNYNTADEYAWGRVAFKEQVGNRSWQGTLTPYVGVEFIGQGNDDIRSQQYGAFVEFNHVPSSVSVMFRGGYKRSSFDFGPDKTGPWFAIGFYHRLR